MKQKFFLKEFRKNQMEKIVWEFFDFPNTIVQTSRQN